ncbi:MAG: response regulator transcription factor [Alistipes senegalensis]|nr:response regulator transcription factor [Bacteroides cellulosilyticus]MCM1351643.1 response regulator transcription factor [Alistipes senegalensis]
MKPAPKYRILLVDDEPDILEFVRYNLVKEGYAVFTAADGAEALRKAAECRPHLILLDMMMPVMDGIQTCRAIRQDPALCDTMVVFLSALGEEQQQLNGFGVGADDYLTKPIKMKLLVSRVQALLKRVPAMLDTPVAAEEPSGATAPDDRIEIDGASHTVRCGSRDITLPRKEFALLELLCASPGKLIPREEIYSRVWGSEVVVGDRTIDVHIRKLRQKIGERHIVTVKGIGYRFEP